MSDATMNGEMADLAVLYSKIARVTAAMKRVPKHGENKFQHYTYATESDIVDTLREALGQEKLAIIPRVDGTERIEHPNERLGPITRLFMTFIIACGDTGASLEMPWIGDGQDTADKGLYKAYTGAEKYFLMKLFLVATGDDPEQDDPPPARQQPAQRRAPPPEVESTAEYKAMVGRFRSARAGLKQAGQVLRDLDANTVKAWPLEKLTHETEIAERELLELRTPSEADMEA